MLFRSRVPAPGHPPLLLGFLGEVDSLLLAVAPREAHDPLNVNGGAIKGEREQPRLVYRAAIRVKARTFEKLRRPSAKASLIIGTCSRACPTRTFSRPAFRPTPQRHANQERGAAQAMGRPHLAPVKLGHEAQEAVLRRRRPVAK